MLRGLRRVRGSPIRMRKPPPPVLLDMADRNESENEIFALRIQWFLGVFLGFREVSIRFVAILANYRVVE